LRRLIDDLVHQNGLLGDGGGDRHSIDLLDAALADLAASEVGDFYLPTDDEEFAAFEVGSGDGGDDVGEARAGGDQGKGLGAELELIEIFCGNSGGNLMGDGDALDAAAATLKQVHDIATRDKEAVGIAQAGEPICEEVAVLRHQEYFSTMVWIAFWTLC
jgi:hypothetical protein